MTLESGTVTVALAAVYLSVAVRRNADPAGLSCTVSRARLPLQFAGRVQIAPTDQVLLSYRSAARPEPTI